MKQTVVLSVTHHGDNPPLLVVVRTEAKTSEDAASKVLMNLSAFPEVPAQRDGEPLHGVKVEWAAPSTHDDNLPVYFPKLKLDN